MNVYTSAKIEEKKKFIIMLEELIKKLKMEIEELEK
jgi:hypothetical protein